MTRAIEHSENRCDYATARPRQQRSTVPHEGLHLRYVCVTMCTFYSCHTKQATCRLPLTQAARDRSGTRAQAGAMSLQLERSKQLEYNLGVLKRRDADIVRVLDMAGHVVLYQFNEESKAWDRRNMEGSLFVVERATEPLHQFVVLNRLSSENLVETIDENFQTE